MRRETWWCIAAIVAGLLASLFLFWREHDRYEWAVPEAFWGLLAIPVLGAWTLWKHSSQVGVLHNSARTTWQELPESVVALSRHGLGALRIVALTALVLVLARPQSSKDLVDQTTEGIDIIMAMDVSTSMLARDFRPNRLESAKEVAQDFVNGRNNDRIGVVVYEGESYTQVPLTTDHRVVRTALSELEAGMIEGGTAIGMGLATAVNRLQNSTAKSKVAILLTDGENNAGQIKPLDAARLAETFDVRVYTIGVGGSGKVPIAKWNPMLQREEIVYIDSKIDEPTLTEMAEMTGGQYFRASSRNKLAEIYQEINALETTRFNTTRYSQKSEKYAPYLWLALAVLLAEILLRQSVYRWTA